MRAWIPRYCWSLKGPSSHERAGEPAYTQIKLCLGSIAAERPRRQPEPWRSRSASNFHPETHATSTQTAGAPERCRAHRALRP
jgi:hypothetical protein